MADLRYEIRLTHTRRARGRVFVNLNLRVDDVETLLHLITGLRLADDAITIHTSVLRCHRGEGIETDGLEAVQIALLGILSRLRESLVEAEGPERKG